MSEPLFEESGTDRLLNEFLGMLPAFPTTIGVFLAEGGFAEVDLADLDHGLLVGYAPQILLHQDLVIVCPLRDAGGGGYDISLKVQKAYFQSGHQTLLHLSATPGNSSPTGRSPAAAKADGVVAGGPPHPARRRRLRAWVRGDPVGGSGTAGVRATVRAAMMKRPASGNGRPGGGGARCSS